MGGPDGGEGGRGGDVTVRADSNLATLLDYTYRDAWVAERGEHGSGSNKTGASGESIVTAGSARHGGPGCGHRRIARRGAAERRRAGRGEGRSRRQGQRLLRHGHAPVRRASGSPARRARSAGWNSSSSSSPTSDSWDSPTPASRTLLSVISAARPKIADYPFTTLAPNLGVVPMSDHRIVRGGRHPRHHRGRARRARDSDCSSCVTSSARASSRS